MWEHLTISHLRYFFLCWELNPRARHMLYHCAPFPAHDSYSIGYWDFLRNFVVVASVVAHTCNLSNWKIRIRGRNVILCRTESLTPIWPTCDPALKQQHIRMHVCMPVCAYTDTHRKKYIQKETETKRVVA